MTFNGATRDIGLFPLLSKHTCVNAIFLMPVCTCTDRLEESKILIMTLSLEISVSARAHAQLSNMGRTKTHLKVPDGVNKEKTALFGYQLLLVMN